MRPKSKKPKVQRKYQFNTPLHEAHKLMSASLSKELRASKGFRSLPVAAGDTVTVVRGYFKGRSGKIAKVDTKRKRVYIEKLVKTKTDGQEYAIGIHPSNLVITKYVTKDKRRVELINRRIKDEAEKIDYDSIIDTVDDEDVIDMDDLDEEDLDLDDGELDDEDLDEEFELDDEEEDDE